jgi:hypothetical protein
MSFANYGGLNIIKFLSMSRGFECRGLNQKLSDSKDFTNVFEPVAGDGDAAEDSSNLAGVLRFRCPNITDVLVSHMA